MKFLVCPNKLVTSIRKRPKKGFIILFIDFQHKSEAISALKEAIMMAQESNDHLCLQHALTWLFRVQPENQHLLMQRCISKCNALGLSYLTSLGMILSNKECQLASI